MANPSGSQHPVIDTGVVRGLAAAYDVREELDLPDETRQAIRNCLRACAKSTFYSWPKIRLNQINWPIEIYAHAAAVLGDPELLRHDTRMQFGRFADACTHVAPGMVVPYLGPGYRFHYLPQTSDGAKTNFDSSEYANIVCRSLVFYERGIRAGMAPLTAGRRVLKAWVERVLCGYWTHSGYPNWDSGLGFQRWHQAKKFPALPGWPARNRRCQALPSHAVLRRMGEVVLRPGAGLVRAPGRQARAAAMRLLRRRVGLRLRRRPPDRLTDGGERLPRHPAGPRQAPGTAPAAVVCLRPRHRAPRDHHAGLHMAIVVDNHRAFPYGGADPARLFDGDQHVVANVGGTGNAAFGMTVINHFDGRRHPLAASPARRHRRPPGIAAAEGAAGRRRAPYRLSAPRLRGPLQRSGLRGGHTRFERVDRLPSPLHGAVHRIALESCPARRVAPRTPSV